VHYKSSCDDDDDDDASEAGNIHSEFGHARPSGSRVIRYIRDGRTDKTNAYCPLSYGLVHNNIG